MFVAGSGAGGVPEVAVFGPEGGAPAGGAAAVVPLPFFNQFVLPGGVAVDNSCFYHEPRLTGSACETFDPSNGDLYVAGHTEANPGGTVVKFVHKLTGEYEPVQELPAAAANDVAVDQNGNVFVSAFEPAIFEFDAAGVPGPKIEQGVVATPGYVAAGPPGVLYVGGNRSFGGTVARVRFGAGGVVQEQTLIDSEGGAGPVAQDRAGDALVGEQTNPRVAEYGSSGALLGSFGIGDFPGASEGVESVAVADETSHAYALAEDGLGGRSISIFGRPSNVTTGAASGVSTVSAMVSGAIDPEGVQVTSCAFQYGPSTSYGASVPCAQSAAEINAGTPPVAVGASLSGLIPGVVYHYRLVETNSDGKGALLAGEDRTFATGPHIESTWTSDVSGESATVNAQIGPQGSPTSFQIEYGTSSAYGTTQPVPAHAIGAGDTPVTASVPIGGLAASTVYHYRVTATNGSGTVYGEDETFTTQVAGRQFTMIDGRQWEMVSPPNKYGARLSPISAQGMIQAASAGNAFTYIASQPTEAHPPNGGLEASQILSVRGRSGWSSRDIDAPVYGPATGAPVDQGFPTRLLSEDLSSSLLQPFGAFAPAGSLQSLSSEATEQTPFVRQDYLNGNVGELCEASCYKPVVTAANTAPGTHFENRTENRTGGCPPICGPRFQGATPDLGAVVVSSPVALTGDMEASGPEELYEWSVRQSASTPLALVSLLPRNSKGEELVAPEPLLGGGHAERRPAGAVSDGGARVVWQSPAPEAPLHLYLRDVVRGETVQLDAPEAGFTPEGTPEPVFQFAAANGASVFFTDGEALTRASGGEGDLYECEIAEGHGGKLECKLHDLTPKRKVAAGEESAHVQGGVLGASKDGSWVYFVANGVLANNGVPVAGAVQGKCGPSEPANALCNLYVRHGGVTSLVALLSNGDLPDWRVNGGQTTRVSANGGWLAFMSQLPLTGYDNTDSATRQRDEEVYLYHAPHNLETEAGALTCASCVPTGERPVGRSRQEFSELLVGGFSIWGQVSPPGGVAANVPAWTPTEYGGYALYQSRYLSDSGRLFFNSNDALVPADVNGTEDVYEYEPQGDGTGSSRCSPESASKSVAFKPARAFSATQQGEGNSFEAHGEEPAGCVGLVSSGTSSEESAFLDASENGNDVFFLTAARLSPLDTDTTFDVYDAHACTSESPCITPPSSPPPCTTADACRAAPSPQPQQLFGAGPTETLSAPGNQPPPAAKPAVKKKTVKCKRNFVKNKKNGCVRKKKTKSKKSAKGRK